MIFTEARTHGVGYYAFSTDEMERAKQQKELEATRAKTLDAQQLRDVQRKARAKIIAERVKAAQNRQRARAGLPPLEGNTNLFYIIRLLVYIIFLLTDNPEPAVPPPLELSAEDIKKQSKLDRLERKKHLESTQREAERKQHVRPWDKGKDTSRKREHSDDDDSEDEWQYKVEQEPMSQEKWNDVQRSKRNPEFAPVSDNILSHRQQFVAASINNEISDIEDEEVDYNIAPPGTTNSTNDLEANFAHPINEFQSRSSSNVAKHQSFATNPFVNQRNKKPFVRRPVDQHQDEEDGNGKFNGRAADVRDPEFAPPATFEYYGPSSGSQKRSAGIKPGQLESSIEAGLKFLRQQSDKDTVSTKMKWASNAGY